MLQDLHIENIAVISRADVSFTEGLNVLTGETGAGKSIIIDSLQSVLGARTSRELVRSDADKALVSAAFVTAEADDWLEENEIETDGDIILQRRISPDGKSSARICGTPVTSVQLREISARLLDIHGQNDGRALLDEASHRRYLDDFGDYVELLAEYSEAYKQFRTTEKEISSLTMDELERERLSENLKSMISELEAADLHEGEEDELSQRRDLLRNSEKLTEAINTAYGMLYDDSDNAVSLTQNALIYTEKASGYCKELDAAVQSLSEAELLLKDAAGTISDILRSLDFSPEEYDALESRLAELRRLSKRYGGDTSILLEKLESAKNQLDDIEFADDRLAKLEKKLDSHRVGAKEAAKKLSVARSASAAKLEERILSELSALNMPSVRFVVDITNISNENGFDVNGADSVRFLMSANRGEKEGPISRIASGGELSRIMLAMKNVFSEGERLETLVFDEIDTGVSGIAAQRVAEKLCQLSKRKQVLCVTHLPQIAAMADTHFLIEKTERDGRTFTEVVELSRDGRARELARLHGGENITENTLKSAHEQLQAAEDFKKSIKRGR